MAGIYPNSDFIICKGVPLDIGYEHTIYQTSRSAQYTAISSYAKHTLSAQSYQRTNRGYIRVGITYDKLYDCNYVMFRNTSYTNTDGTAKWFYAFITKCEYINDNCSDIEYEIDVMQTWYFDYEMGTCFIEREHTLTDSVDDNFEPEPFDFGDYLVQSTRRLHFKWNESAPLDIKYVARIYYIPNEYLIKINTDPSTYEITTYTQSKTDPTTGIFNNGMYIAGDYINVPIYGGSASMMTLTAQNISNVVDAIVENSGSIITIQFVPNVTFTDVTIVEDSYFDDNVGNTYLPQNHKMYHYPYRKILVSNSQGKQKEYKWECFRTTSAQNVKTATFSFNLAKIPKAEAYLYPTDYGQIDIENGMVFDGFPTYTWSEDSFSKWWAQNGTGAIMSMVSGAITSFIGLSIGKTAGSVSKYLGSRTALNTVNDSIGFLGNIANQAATPDTQNGSFSGDISTIAQNRMGFTLYDMGIRPEIARTIDNYFTKFGYTCNKLKTINVLTEPMASLRPHWNYIKTSSCTCHGNNMNASDERKIEEIFNNGITFWLNKSEVGDYSYNNYPRG